MTASHSTPALAKSKPAKPEKPDANFLHATGRWAKMIRGKLHYFGPWSDPTGSLKKYQDYAEALHAVRLPRPTTNEQNVAEMVNEFLNFKRHLAETGKVAWDMNVRDEFETDDERKFGLFEDSKDRFGNVRRQFRTMDWKTAARNSGTEFLDRCGKSWPRRNSGKGNSGTGRRSASHFGFGR